MSDFELLQGLWEIQPTTYDHPATHYFISGNSMREIVPDLVDDGTLRSTFVLDESTSPKRLTQILDYNGPDGPPDPDPIILRYLYCLDGETLTLYSDEFEPGEFPSEISDDHSILTLVRDHGPIPESKNPSGTPPLTDELLGTLAWDDNLSWYRGLLKIDGHSFALSLTPDIATDATNAKLRAKQIVANFARYRMLAAEYAVRGLLDLKNSSWLDEDGQPITADEFKARISLNSIVVEADGNVTFWHSDGDLFFGHSVQVCMDADDNCTDTDIPG